MIETRDLRVEANRLVSGGVARDLEHARAIIRDLDERRERSDAVLFYVNPSVKNSFPIISQDEKVYNNTGIRIAQVPSGALNEDFASCNIALGRIIEYVPRDSSDSFLAARINDFPHESFDGFYLTSFSSKVIRGTGRMTFEDRYLKDEGVNLERVEFLPVNGNFLVGMFTEWGNRFGVDGSRLVLYIARRHFLQI